MVPSKKNKVRFNLEKRTNTSRGKIIQNADSVGVTNLESSTCSRPPFHSPKSELTFQCTHSPFSPSFPKEGHFSRVPIECRAEIFNPSDSNRQGELGKFRRL